MLNAPLGTITPETFLAEYWQKQPLLLRQAVTQFDWMPSLAELRDLAARDDVESRLVEHRDGRWRCESGPFRPARHKRLGESDWTLLVQNANHHQRFCAELLHRFAFIPQVRLDDLMISYAPPGGSVGPHFDSYDVFLLQVGGKKRWQISGQTDLSLIDGAPLKLLQHFVPEQEWVLEHGDMLYLPPRFAHHGVALEAGQTWSIGFRAPTTQELATQFLDYLRDHIELDGIYSDPDLRATTEPAHIPVDFAAQIGAMLQKIQWDKQLVARFIGGYFSEPKPHVFFDTADDLFDEAEFAKAVAQAGVWLNLKSVMLYDDSEIYLNGEPLNTPDVLRPALQKLANNRHLPAGEYDDELLDFLYAQYELGYLAPAESTAR